MSENVKSKKVKTSLLRHIAQPDAKSLPESYLCFLQSLKEPTAIHLDGEKPGCRVVITLLHGNETSGFKAIYRLLKEGIKPAVDTKVIIVGVKCALQEPVFTVRCMPSGRDLNHCFSAPFEGREGRLAQEIIHCLEDWNPEAVVDIQNTVGSGPAFCVARENQTEQRALASHFSDKLVQTHLHLGAIMHVPMPCPVITVEVGGAYDNDADFECYNGLKRFMRSDNINKQQQEIQCLSDLIRLEIDPLASLAYSDRPVFGVNVTLRDDIEQLNFKTTKAGEILGWVDHGKLLHFNILGDEQNHEVSDYLEASDNQLKAKCPMQILMATEQHDIAIADCVLYFTPLHVDVQPQEQSITSRFAEAYHTMT